MTSQTNSDGITISQYTTKSVVVRGDSTKIYRDMLVSFGGKWNKNLKGGGGWIFSKTKEKQLHQWLLTITPSNNESICSDILEEKYNHTITYSPDFDIHLPVFLHYPQRNNSTIPKIPYHLFK